MKSTTAQRLLPALLLSASIFAGETQPPVPETPPKPVTPTAPVITATPVPLAQNPYAALTPALQALQGADEAKRVEAAKIFVEKGGVGHRLLGNLAASPDAATAQRAKDIRAQIEKRATEMLQAAEAEQLKLQNIPLTPVNIEAVRALWAAAAAYAPQPEYRQQAQQYEQMMKMQVNEVEEANKALAANEAKLAAKPAPSPLAVSTIELERAQSYVTLQRFDDATKSAQASAEAGGKDGRHTPSAIRIQLELAQRKSDHPAIEALCKKLLADHGEALEAALAYGALIDIYSELKRWDEAVATAKNYMTVSPIDESAQDSAFALMDRLMDVEHDYPRAYGLSGWLKTKLPPSRIKPEVLKVLGGCSEYALKDYAKAEAAYKTLAEQFGDVVQVADMENAIKRVKAKAEGKFPTEPKPGDDNPSAALAKFLAAVRARDAKAVSAAVPAALAKDAAEALTQEGSELVPTAMFADYIIKTVNADGDKAEIVIDYYDAASFTPKLLTQKALKENGAWKIQWQDPEAQITPVKKE